VEPNGVLIYENIALTNIYLNRLDEATASVQNAFAHNLDDVSLHALLFQIAFLRGDAPTMKREMAWSLGKPGVEDVFLDGQADFEASVGHIAKARELTQRAADSVVRSGSRETAAAYLAKGALRDAEVGDFQEAVKQAEAAMALAPNQETQFLAALAYARARREVRATNLAKQLDHEYPLSTSLQSYWLPTIRAAVQLNRGDAGGAIQSLQATIPLELGASRPFVAIYPVYLRGQALLVSRQGSAAAAEFEKLLDHRTLTTFVTPSLAKLQLGRAYAMSNEASKAKNAYQEFLKLWKDADADLPVLRDAKSEYANLNQFSQM
jgi:eukaryotic-like serine/threonine-protein kinase